MNRQQATEELAVRVIGWHRDVPLGGRWRSADMASWVGSWNPWDDIADAMMLLEQLNDRQFTLKRYAPDDWTAEISSTFNLVFYLKGYANAPKPAEAITLAVCKAYGIEIEEVGNA